MMGRGEAIVIAGGTVSGGSSVVRAVRLGSGGVSAVARDAVFSMTVPPAMPAPTRAWKRIVALAPGESAGSSRPLARGDWPGVGSGIEAPLSVVDPLT